MFCISISFNTFNSYPSCATLLHAWLNLLFFMGVFNNCVGVVLTNGFRLDFNCGAFAYELSHHLYLAIMSYIFMFSLCHV